MKGRFDKVLTKSPGVPRFGVSPERDVSDKTWPTRSLPDLDLRRHRAVRELARQRAEAIYVVDREFRRLIETLRDTGELANTVVVFSSDNGHFLGEHRKLTGKLLPYEPSFRVPMLVRSPGGESGDRYAPVTSVDLGATLLDITGSRTLFPKSVDGASFWPLVHGGDRAYDRPAYYEAVVGAMNANRPGLSGFGVRTSRWKLVLYNNGKRELYDLVRRSSRAHQPRRRRTTHDRPSSPTSRASRRSSSAATARPAAACYRRSTDAARRRPSATSPSSSREAW